MRPPGTSSYFLALPQTSWIWIVALVPETSLATSYLLRLWILIVHSISYMDLVVLVLIRPWDLFVHPTYWNFLCLRYSYFPRRLERGLLYRSLKTSIATSYLLRLWINWNSYTYLFYRTSDLFVHRTYSYIVFHIWICSYSDLFVLRIYSYIRLTETSSALGTPISLDVLDSNGLLRSRLAFGSKCLRLRYSHFPRRLEHGLLHRSLELPLLRRTCWDYV